MSLSSKERVLMLGAQGFAGERVQGYPIASGLNSNPSLFIGQNSLGYKCS